MRITVIKQHCCRLLRKSINLSFSSQLLLFTMWCWLFTFSIIKKIANLLSTSCKKQTAAANTHDVKKIIIGLSSHEIICWFFIYLLNQDLSSDKKKSLPTPQHLSHCNHRAIQATEISLNNSSFQRNTLDTFHDDNLFRDICKVIVDNVSYECMDNNP